MFDAVRTRGLAHASGAATARTARACVGRVDLAGARDTGRDDGGGSVQRPWLRSFLVNSGFRGSCSLSFRPCYSQDWSISRSLGVVPGLDASSRQELWSERSPFSGSASSRRARARKPLGPHAVVIWPSSTPCVCMRAFLTSAIRLIFGLTPGAAGPSVTAWRPGRRASPGHPVEAAGPGPGPWPVAASRR